MTMPSTDRTRPRRLRRRVAATRGQILVIFALSIFVFISLSAVVIDVSWFWSSELRMQRAADAAALAGVVHLPGDVPDAIIDAKQEAAKNGYPDGVGTNIVTAWQDPTNPRRLRVTVEARVGTFFARVIGINSFPAAAKSQADFILPVPMGSPQNYYGVGNFLNLVTPADVTNNFVTPSTWVSGTPSTGLPPSSNTTTNTTGGAWTTPANTYLSDNVYSTSATNLNQEAWKGFTFPAFQAGATIDGVVIYVEAKTGVVKVACQVKAEVSWDAGTTWGSTPLTTPNLSAADVWYPLGSSSNAAAWGANHTSWAFTDFTTASNFQVRLTNLKGAGCTTTSVDEITAVVYSHTVTTFPPAETLQTLTGPGGATLSGGSQGFWGADITLGGDRGNGDQYDPAKDGAATNPNFDGTGVDYTIVIGGASGQVQLYDPTFCETGQNSSGGYLGAGDHWIAGSANPVTTVYSLYDEQNTPYDTTDDGPAKATLSYTSQGADYSSAMGQDRNYNATHTGSVMHSGLTDCSSNAAHNAWVQLASGLPATTYRLNVSTNVVGNNATSAENMWAAWVSAASGTSKIYGEGTMVTYNNLTSGTQVFYLAQIDKVHAGKTMEISLFDPGDVTGGSWLRILSPDGNVYTPASFSYTADANASSGHTSGSGTCIQTNGGSTAGLTPPVGCTNLTSGGSFYQDSVITIQVVLPPGYGSVGSTPPGVPGAGWWKIEYTVGGGNDTTTWAVQIRGNPVHLVLP
jgi:Flp pilus assembly protein TadG